MHKSTDFSKTKLISNPMKEIAWDTSDENDKKLDAKTMNLEQLIELQKRLENKNNSDEREEGKIRGSFSDLGTAL